MITLNASRKSVGSAAPNSNPGYADVFHVNRFLDHADTEALCFSRGFTKLGTIPLRCPFSFQLYITSGAKASDAGIGSQFLEFYRCMHNLFPRDMKFWSLAVYFLPPPWSVNKHESVVTHYKKERAHREDTDWPIPKSYRTLDKLYDGFCLVVDREDAWIGEGQNIDDEIEGTIEALEFEYNPTGDMIEDPSDQLPTPDSYVYSLNVASGIMFVVYDGIWGEEGQEEFYKRQQEHLAQYGIELD